jgi:hypothetical protein
MQGKTFYSVSLVSWLMAGPVLAGPFFISFITHFARFNPIFKKAAIWYM